jgi:hypothetical protein
MMVVNNVKTILDNDRHPTKAVLKREFTQKLKGFPLTQREIRQAMLYATDSVQLNQLLELSEELEND